MVFLVWVHEMHQSPWPASTGQSFTPSSSSFSSLLGAPMPRLPFLSCDIFTSEHVSCVLALITDHKKNFRYLGSLFTFTLLKEGLRDAYVGDREICCEMDAEPWEWNSIWRQENSNLRNFWQCLDMFWLVEHPDFTVCRLGSLLHQVLN